MLKRKSSMDIDDVMNHINTWLDHSDDEAEDHLNEVNGDEEIIPSEQNASEDETYFDCDYSGFSQNRPIYRKQLTPKRLVLSIDSSFDESNFEPIFYVNRNVSFETFTGYLGPKANKNTKQYHGTVNFLL